jgi:hypothetical protein
MIAKLTKVTALVAAAAMLAAGAYAGEAGTSGFVFLRLGNGARAAGMGEAFTAVADDATSIYWNPAGMANIHGVELNLTHSEWFQDIRFEQVSVLNEMFGGTAGLSFTGVYYGSMDRYGTFPSLEPDGTFSPYDLSVSGGYAYDVLPNLSVGATGKVIYEKIDFESATGWAVDVGVFHRSMIRGLTLAASMLNLGPQASFVTEKFYPPFQFRFGACYRYDADVLRGGALIAADAVFPNDGDAKVNMGAEYNYRGVLSVRAGYKANYYTQGATLGAGVYYHGFRFDYAYMPMDFDLGDSHRFSVSIFSSGP